MLILTQIPERFLSIIGQDHGGVSKSNQLHVDIFRIFLY